MCIRDRYRGGDATGTNEYAVCRKYCKKRIECGEYKPAVGNAEQCREGRKVNQMCAGSHQYGKKKKRLGKEEKYDDADNRQEE